MTEFAESLSSVCHNGRACTSLVRVLSIADAVLNDPVKKPSQESLMNLLSTMKRELDGLHEVILGGIAKEFLHPFGTIYSLCLDTISFAIS